MTTRSGAHFFTSAATSASGCPSQPKSPITAKRVDTRLLEDELRSDDKDETLTDDELSSEDDSDEELSGDDELRTDDDKDEELNGDDELRTDDDSDEELSSDDELRTDDDSEDELIRDDELSTEEDSDDELIRDDELYTEDDTHEELTADEELRTEDDIREELTADDENRDELMTEDDRLNDELEGMDKLELISELEEIGGELDTTPEAIDELLKVIAEENTPGPGSGIALALCDATEDTLAGDEELKIEAFANEALDSRDERVLAEDKFGTELELAFARLAELILLLVGAEPPDPPQPTKMEKARQ